MRARNLSLIAAAAVAMTATFASAQDHHEEHGGGRTAPPPRAAAPARPAAQPAPPRSSGGGDHRFDGRSGRQEFLPGGQGRPPQPAGGGYAAAPGQQRFTQSYGQGGSLGRFQGGQAGSGYVQGRPGGGYGYHGDERRASDGRGYPGGRDGYGSADRGGDRGRGYGGYNYGRGYGGFGYDRGDRHAFFFGGRTFYRYHADAYRWPDERWRGYHWYRGAFLPPFFLIQDYYITEYDDFGLAPPPYGYQWVRVGYDALLVNIYDGQVYDVVPGVFY